MCSLFINIKSTKFTFKWLQNTGIFLEAWKRTCIYWNTNNASLKCPQYHDILFWSYCLVIKQGQQNHLQHVSHFHTLSSSFSHWHTLLVSVRTERDHQSCCPANGERCVCHREVNHSQLWVVLRPVLRASRSERPSHQSLGPGTASPAYTSSGLRYTAVICSWTRHSPVTLPALTRVRLRRTACFWPGMEYKRTYRTCGRR